MEKVAVIDMGSARTKVAIMQDLNGSVLRLKDETNLSSHVNSGEMDLSFIAGNIVPKLKEYIDKAKAYGCKRVLTIGTHVFRSSKNSAEAQAMIESVTGRLNVLDSWLEGAIFFSWMRKLTGKRNIVVMDIGGGSVQVANGDTKERVLSFNTGTFTLEKQFQHSKERATPEEISLMKAFIVGAFKEKISDLNIGRHDLVIMGSNCMEDFIRSAFGKAQYDLSDDCILSLNEIKNLFSEISAKDYSSLSGFFPANKFFMYGADKALLNLTALCETTHTDKIMPTNESLSSALLNLLSLEPGELEKLSLHHRSL